MPSPKSPNRRLRVITVAGILVAALGAGIRLQAADHKDAPASSETNLDITDLYAFSRGDSMVFIMNVSPFLAPGAATVGAAFNPDGLYQFKLDKERDGVEDAVIQVTVSRTDSARAVSVRGPGVPTVRGTAANALLKDSTVAGPLNQVFHGPGVTAFAGPRDDPFFLHLMGDSSLTSVLNAAYSAALDTTVGSPTQQSLAFSKTGHDDFAGTNVLSIVVKIPKAVLADRLGMAVTAPFYVWATTSIKD